MTTNKPRVRRDQSLIEILANMETIDTMLEQGFNMKRIFERLQESGAFSISYWAFRRTLIKMRPKSPHKTRLALPAGAKPSLPVPQGGSAPTHPRSGPQILGNMEKVNPVNPQQYLDFEELIGSK